MPPQPIPPSAVESPVQVEPASLFSEITEGYKPALQHYITSYELGLPQFTMKEVSLMMHDPQIRLNMALKTAPLLKPVIILTGHPAVVMYVQDLLRRIWSAEMHKILNALWWTASGGELVWMQDQGALTLHHLKEIHPADMLVLVKHGRKVGLRIQNNVFLHGYASANWSGMESGARSTTAAANPVSSIPPLLGEKSFVYTHRRQFGSWIGRSELEGAYRPWLTKNQRRGALHARDLFFYKSVYHGGIIFHPPGGYRDTDGQHKLYRDLARQIMEYAENGAVYTLEAGLMDDGKTPKWQIVSPQATATDAGIAMLDYVDKLDIEITRGMEIPDDILTRTEGSGGTFGRTIPLISYYIGQTQHLRGLVAELKEQILDPGVRLNFGPEAVSAYRIEQVEIDLDALMPIPQAPGMEAGPPPEGGGGGPLVIGEPQQMSMTRMDGDRMTAVFKPHDWSDEARKLMAPTFKVGLYRQTQFGGEFEEALQPNAPANGVVIHGTYFRPGEPLPPELIEKLSPDEKSQLASTQRQNPSEDLTQPLIGPRETEYRQQVSDARKQEQEASAEQFPKELQSFIGRQARGMGGPLFLEGDDLSRILSHGRIAFISAGRNPEERDMPDEDVQVRHGNLLADLNESGYSWVPLTGVYGGAPESSFMVFDIHPDEASRLAQRHGQESVLLSNKGQNWLRYTSGDKEGKAHPGTGWEMQPDNAEDFYSQVRMPGGEKRNFNLHLDFSKLRDWEETGKETPKQVEPHQQSQMAEDDDNVPLRLARQYNPKYTPSSSRKSSADVQGPIAETYARLPGVTDPQFKETPETQSITRKWNEVLGTNFGSYKDLVNASYNQLSQEVQHQYDTVKGAGQQFTFHSGEQEYPDSPSMFKDVHSKRHLNVYQGGEPHPHLGQEADKEGLTLNDKFRAIHDYFGHATGRTSFGPKGEENAWMSHAQMFSPLARLAMSTETRGQNSWVNYSGANQKAQEHFKRAAELRRQARATGNQDLLSEAEQASEQGRKLFQFAQQKSLVLPYEHLSEAFGPDYDLKPYGGPQTTRQLSEGEPEEDKPQQPGVPKPRKRMHERQPEPHKGEWSPGKDPPVHDQPIYAIRLKDDRILYDKQARQHADVVSSHSIDPDSITSGGWINQGRYVGGSDAVDRLLHQRKVQQEKEAAQKHVEGAFQKAHPHLPQVEDQDQFISAAADAVSRKAHDELQQLGITDPESFTNAVRSHLFSQPTGNFADSVRALMGSRPKPSVPELGNDPQVLDIPGRPSLPEEHDPHAKPDISQMYQSGRPVPPEYLEQSIAPEYRGYFARDIVQNLHDTQALEALLGDPEKADTIHRTWKYLRGPILNTLGDMLGWERKIPGSEFIQPFGPGLPEWGLSERLETKDRTGTKWNLTHHPVNGETSLQIPLMSNKTLAEQYRIPLHLTDEQYESLMGVLPRRYQLQGLGQMTDAGGRDFTLEPDEEESGVNLTVDRNNLQTRNVYLYFEPDKGNGPDDDDRGPKAPPPDPGGTELERPKTRTLAPTVKSQLDKAFASQVPV